MLEDYTQLQELLKMEPNTQAYIARGEKWANKRKKAVAQEDVKTIGDALNKK